MRRKLRLLLAGVFGLVVLLLSTASPAGAQTGEGVVPLTPCVVLDTTQGIGAFSGPLDGAQELDVQVSGALNAVQGGAADCGVPSGASGVVVDVAVVDPLRPGNLRIFPTGVPSTGGVVNFADQSPGLDNSNAVIVPLSSAGQLTLVVNAGGSAAATTHVRLTVIGYTDPSGLRYTPITPCAVFDSRPNQGAGSNTVWFGPFEGSESRTITVAGTFDINQGGGEGNCGVSVAADAVLVNLVGLNAVGNGGLGVRAAGDTDTTVYTAYAGLTPTMNNANAVIVPLSAAGDLDVYSVAGPNDSANGRVVVLGYLETEGDGYVPLSPCAAFDSRSNQGATGDLIGPFDGGEIVVYQLTGQLPANQGGGGNDCGVPVGASAVLMNLVAINPVREGNLRVNAVGTTPSGGVVNFAALDPAMNNSNAVAVPLSADGRIEVGVNAGSFGAGQPAVGVRGVVLGYFVDDDRELSIDITLPAEGPIASSPTTVSGVATDDVGVEEVEVWIEDAPTGRFLALCGVDDYCFLSLEVAPRFAASLTDPGTIVTEFSLGPIDLELAGGSGSYRARALVRDADGNEAEDGLPFRTIAVTRPTIELVAPADGGTAEDQVELHVVAIDDQTVTSVRAVLQDVNSGIYLQQNGLGAQSWLATGQTFIPLVRIPGTDSWTALVRAPLSNGRTVRVVQIAATDSTGSSNFLDPDVVFTIGEDTVPPTVDITVPSPNQVIPQPMVLRGTAFDAAGVTNVDLLVQDANLGVYWNGSTWVSQPVWISADKGGEVVADVQWSRSFPSSLHDLFGSVNFFVTARATDVVGQQTTTSQVLFSTTVDTQPPVVSLNDPSNRLLSGGPTTVGGRASDNTGVAAVSLTIFDPATGDYWAAPGWVDDPVEFIAELDDPNAVLTDWSLDLFDPNAGSGSGSFVFTVRAVDLAGLVTSIDVTLDVDDTGPDVVFTEPDNGDFLFDGEKELKFLGEANDPAGIASVEVEIRDVSAGSARWWNGAAWVSSQARVPAVITESNATGAEFEFVGLLPGTSGEHTIDAFVTDGLGNVGSSGRLDFFVDEAAPTISFTGPGSGISSPFGVRVNAEDDFEVDSVEFRVEDLSTGLFFDGTGFVVGEVWLDVPNQSSLSIDPDGAGGSGEYEVFARVTDLLDKTDVVARTYETNDDEDPVVMITSISNESIIESPTAIQGTATDNRAVVSVEVELRERLCGSDYYDGTSFVSAATTIPAVIDSGSGTGDVTWTAALTPNGLEAAGGCGEYQVRARAFDAQGNTAFSSLVVFDTDTEDPTVAITQPTSSTVSAPFNLFILGSDDSPGLQIFYTLQDTGTGEYWNGDEFVASETELPFTGLVELFGKGDPGSGDYKLEAWAIDVVGNRSANAGLLFSVV